MLDALLKFTTRGATWAVARGTPRHTTQGRHIAVAVKLKGKKIKVCAVQIMDAEGNPFELLLKDLRNDLGVTSLIHATDNGTRFMVEKAGLYSRPTARPDSLHDFGVVFGRGVDPGDAQKAARLIGLIVTAGAIEDTGVYYA